ncbi:MAG: primosomal protein N', partial [Puniceicoccales bacterium]|nr:primosomal protein N' [Puniceicoccales bacterium]
MERRCVEILTFAGLDKPLSYAIPPELDGIVAVGMLVRVPLGRSVTLGIVTDVHRADADALPYRVREIIAIEYDYPLLGRDTMALVEWMSRYYAASNKSVLEAIIPAAIRNNISAKFSAKVSLLKFLSDDERSLLKRRAPKQHELYQFLLENGAVERSAAVKFSSSAVNSLLGKGIIGETFRVQDRLVYGEFTDAGATSRAADIALTEEQRMAADDIAKSLTIGKFCTHLLHGVTGSGKTEVYACGIRRVLDGGGDVIYLVPELALTPQTVSRIRRAVNLYGVEVVVWHSGLSDGERRDAWLAMASGRSRVVIGARSAIFAPLKNVRLIIVDEEHEVTYKQSDSPRYHARDVAVYRAKLCDAVCILGSATPSMESLFNVSLSKYKLNCLKNRVDGSKLPAMEVVDMRHERTSRGVKIISSRLMELVAACLANGEQTILFLNKRGYASVVFCQCCDYVAACPHCSMSLTYHRQQHLLRCHICGYVEELPTK